jgi:hypothetical protein
MNLTEEDAEEVVQAYDATGFGFRKTRFDGDAVASRAWVCSQLEHVPTLELLFYMETGWAQQDVVACRAKPAS